MQPDDQVGRRGRGLFGAHVDGVVGIAGIEVTHLQAAGLARGQVLGGLQQRLVHA
jgi:hypothetical protein